jgi:hypothetical protein
MATMYETQPQEVWRSSRDFISVRTDKKKPSSRSSGGPKQISKTGHEEEDYGKWLQEMVGRYHSHSCDDGGRQFTRCSSVVVQKVEAPVSTVWSLVRHFGLSHLTETELSHISTCTQGTLGYLDPEYYKNYQLTDKSDVYSFGVVLLELVTSQKAIDFNREPEEVNLPIHVLNQG